MSSWNEINDALKALSNHKIILMQCTSLYPCPENLVGLNVINEMKENLEKNMITVFLTILKVQKLLCSICFGANYVENITFSKKCMGLMLNFLWNQMN